MTIGHPSSPLEGGDRVLRHQQAPPSGRSRWRRLKQHLWRSRRSQVAFYSPARGTSAEELDRFHITGSAMIDKSSDDIFLITGSQLRAARALLDISAQKLAGASGIGIATIRRAEAQSGPVKITRANAERLTQVLEDAGVEFIRQNGGGPGVRLKSR